MANGKLIYPSGEVSQVTYTFALNYDFGHEQGYIDSDDNQRAFDGTLYSYTGAKKKTFALTFTRVTKAQKDALQLAYVVGGKIDLYLDGTTLDATVKIMSPPNATSEEAFIGADYTYSLDLEMEEV